MRRGNPRGRGNRQMHHPMNQNPRPSSSGPLMTSHLQMQGLKDIDMELELLKRKREIIEQQQEMLSNTYRQRNDYEQPMFSQSRDKHYDDYTRLYDNPRESDSYGGGASNRKRPHIQVWENELPPKRFSGPNRGAKKAFGSRLGPPPNNPRAEFQRPVFSRQAPKSFKPRSANPAPSQKNREFNPTKVTKSSSAAPPAKLSSYQLADRKKLVTEALANSAATPRGGLNQSDSWILRADRAPSRQLNGRLELALGNIMKELKHAKPDFEQLFHQPVPTRVMKQVVRERIRTAMMDKLANSVENIKATYRQMFPSSKDDDIVMKGLEAQKGAEFITIKSEDPETYFKKNMFRLMSVKLDEMTNKLAEIYCEANPGVPMRKKYKHYIKPKTQTIAEDAQPKAKDGEPKTGESEPKTGDSEPKTGDIEPKTGDSEHKTGDKEVKTGDGEDKTGDVEPKTGDVEPKTVDDAPVDEVQSKADEVQSKADDVTELVDEPATVKAKTNESQTKSNEELVVDKVSTTENEAPADSINPPPYMVNTEQYLAFEKVMTYKLINLLKKFSPAILKIMDVDAMYRRVKATIVSETRKKLGVTEDDPQAPQKTPKKASPETRFLHPLQYYVKILGKPSLPKRKAMEGFFSQYEPRSIKKHRTIHNLLFVGFAEKEPYEKMLAANGTVIGRFTLDIKISERNWNPKNGDSSVITIEDNKSSEVNPNSSGSEIIGSDLDDQITDLLTSIRKAEDSFSDDVVMTELPASGDQKENGDQSANEESVAKEDDTIQESTEKVDDDNDVEVIPENDDDVVEIKDVPQVEETNVQIQEAENETSEEKDVVEALKVETKGVPGTPTRVSARLSTPGGIRTRRMSKLTE